LAIVTLIVARCRAIAQRYILPLQTVPPVRAQRRDNIRRPFSEKGLSREAEKRAVKPEV
jgi:hypothetical protein